MISEVDSRALSFMKNELLSSTTQHLWRLGRPSVTTQAAVEFVGHALSPELTPTPTQHGLSQRGRSPVPGQPQLHKTPSQSETTRKPGGSQRAQQVVALTDRSLEPTYVVEARTDTAL